MAKRSIVRRVNLTLRVTVTKPAAAGIQAAEGLGEEPTTEQFHLHMEAVAKHHLERMHAKGLELATEATLAEARADVETRTAAFEKAKRELAELEAALKTEASGE